MKKKPTKENFSSGICVSDFCCCPDVIPQISWHITHFCSEASLGSSQYIGRTALDLLERPNVLASPTCLCHALIDSFTFKASSILKAHLPLKTILVMTLTPPG